MGDNKALKYNINQAIKNSPTLEIAHKNIDIAIQQADNTHTRELLESFKNNFDEIISEIKKIDTSKKEITPQEVLPKIKETQKDNIQGDNFLMGESDIKYPYNAFLI